MHSASPSDESIGRSAFRRHGTVVFADIAESVRLMERDEEGTVARWRALVARIANSILGQTGGRLVKSMGDGLMLEFADPVSAVRASLAIQHETKDSNAGVAPAERIQLRIGAHTGEHLSDALDLYGHDVNLAARVMGVAGPGEVVVSAAVRDQILDEIDAQIEDLGDCWLKHVSAPVRCYRLGPPGLEPAVLASNPTQDLRATIAVLPPVCRDPTPDHQVLGEIFADNVIRELSRSEDLDVISRLTTSALRGRSITPAQIARRLGATFVLSGQYMVTGSRVSVTAELCHTGTSKVLWSDSVSGSVTGLLSGDSALFDRVIGAIRASLVSASIQRLMSQPLPSLESFTLMMAAVALMHRQSRQDFDRSRRALEVVIERAPRHPSPRAWLAKWHVLRLMQGWANDPVEGSNAALAESARALDLDGGYSLALAIDGLAQMHFLKRLDVAEERFSAAITANPNDSLAWLLKGTLHAFRGEGREAVRSTGRALRLSPLDPLKYYYDSLSATAALAAGEPQRAVELAQRSIRSNRLHTSTLRALAIGRWQLGDATGARSAIEQLLTSEPGLTVSAWRARTPSRGHAICEDWAKALEAAGLPP